MNVNALEHRAVGRAIVPDRVRGGADEAFRPFAGVVAGVAIGSLMWLALIWLLRSLV